MKTLHTFLLTLFFVAPAFGQFRINQIATTNRLGVIKVDGLTTFVDKNGKLSANGGGGPTNGQTAGQVAALIDATNTSVTIPEIVTRSNLLWMKFTNAIQSGTSNASFASVTSAAGIAGASLSINGGSTVMNGLNLVLGNVSLVGTTDSAFSPVRRWSMLTIDPGNSFTIGPTNAFVTISGPLYATSFNGSGAGLTGIPISAADSSWSNKTNFWGFTNGAAGVAVAGMGVVIQGVDGNGVWKLAPTNYPAGGGSAFPLSADANFNGHAGTNFSSLRGQNIFVTDSANTIGTSIETNRVASGIGVFSGGSSNYMGGTSTITNIWTSTNTAPTSVTIGTTVPDKWIEVRDLVGNLYKMPVWTNH